MSIVEHLATKHILYEIKDMVKTNIGPIFDFKSMHTGCCSVFAGQKKAAVHQYQMNTVISCERQKYYLMQLKILIWKMEMGQVEKMRFL